ncbi:Exostosin-like [Quillaja saponaria]|uniref:Exostosin-like n=1 Tax=Quillaja saponaria TaxID=32244 RepID=A0AAD7VHN6_QUISA|nr:Exostosin-like [Quillaja saponaria]
MGLGGSNKNWSLWCTSKSTSSAKLLLFMVPLMVVAGLIFVLGPNASNWVLIFSHPSGSYWGSRSGTTSNGIEVHLSSEKKEREEITVGVVVAVNHAHHNMEEALSDDTTLNRSSSPPLAIHHSDLVQPLQHQQQSSDASGEYGINGISKNHPSHVVSSTNESYLALTEDRRQRKFTSLNRTEISLIQARAAIRKAKNGNPMHDPDYVPVGPMYLNANAFHRSYLEMERQFKIFVYEEGEPPVFHNGPCKSIYSMEGNFIHGLEMNSQFRTRDPEKAHVYFLPFSVAMMVQFVYIRDSHDMSPIKKTVSDYIKVIAGRYPYWNGSLGADHFMLACHDWGPETSFSNPYLFKNSIRVLCNANTSEGFNPSKDASFPEINLQTGSINGFVGGPSPSKRPILAFFAGGLHGPIRPVLLEHWENKDEDIRVHRYLPKGVSYNDMMRKSKYCICPSGYEVASPRVVEAIYTGCVPVLISDHYVPPFSDVLNWKSFSVEVPVKDIPNLKRILMGISSRQYIRMQRRLVQIRRHFEVHSPPKRFDVFHMILHSVWLRRLNVRVT